MRIITGSLKNRVVPRLDSKRDRPTTAYIREMVFSIIGPNLIQGCNFLDLFCGSGIVGLEAISRGASHVTFVDSEFKHIAGIVEVARLWALEKQVEAVCSDAGKWLKSKQQRSASLKYDIVYADPPYFSGKPDKLYETFNGLIYGIMQSQDLFADSCLLFLELSRESVKSAPEKPQGIRRANAVKSLSEGGTSPYHCQFDAPWPEIYRSLGIPLEIPLFDWRLTGTTAILIMGMKACEPVREIY